MTGQEIHNFLKKNPLFSRIQTIDLRDKYYIIDDVFEEQKDAFLYIFPFYISVYPSVNLIYNSYSDEISYQFVTGNDKDYPLNEVTPDLLIKLYTDLITSLDEKKKKLKLLKQDIRLRNMENDFRRI